VLQNEKTKQKSIQSHKRDLIKTVLRFLKKYKKYQNKNFVFRFENIIKTMKDYISHTFQLETINLKKITKVLD